MRTFLVLREIRADKKRDVLVPKVFMARTGDAAQLPDCKCKTHPFTANLYIHTRVTQKF